MIRARELSSREVVEAHIRRIQAVNPVLNAVTDERFAEARAEAELADQQVASGSPEASRPFHGVPCTIKECQGLAGMRKTAGLWAHRERRAVEDGTATARLKAHGAIPLAVTNVSELMMWMETSNRVFGRTNNPYDPTRTVGGSSGGEGAIVGAGGSPMGLGSDVGGSIRMPAFFNGVFGHKPTGGLVPATGIWPAPENDARRYLTTGPLCRRAEDLMPFLRAVAGPDGKDAGCRTFELGDPASVRLDRLRVFDVEGNGAITVEPELAARQREVAAFLRQAGARVETLEIPELERSFQIWSALMDEAAETRFAELLGDGHPIRAGRELLRWALGRSPHTLPALALALIEKVPAALPSLGKKFVAMGHALKASLSERLGEGGILLYPPYPEVAPRHHRPLWPPFNWQYTAIFNVLELPVTQVPLGLGQKGVPLGVQVAARAGHDHVTIAVAQALERAFGGWVVPAVARTNTH